MLLDPCQELTTVPGTRILATDPGVVGAFIEDPTAPRRLWTIQSLYAPILNRHLGGIRAKLVDSKGFATFCNQRDLEVLLNIAAPGDWCKWAGEEYPSPKDERWIGFCMDAIDLMDDLYERELMLRAEYQGVLPNTLSIQRLIHAEPGRDFEDWWVLLNDADPHTGLGPDSRYETLYDRWVLSSRERLEWRKI